MRHQQPPPWQQEQLEGTRGIADALARLQCCSVQGSKSPSQQNVPSVERRSSGGAGNRSRSRPFGQAGGGSDARHPGRRDAQRSRQSESEAVRVVVRVRPTSEREMSAGLQRVVSVDNEETMSVVDPTAFAAALALERDGQEKVEPSMWIKRFSFDRCFFSGDGDRNTNKGDGQEKVFDEIGATVIDHAFSGYNATVFAYGQTGSGKSYTMMGSGAALDENVDPEDHGLIPRICSGILERVEQMEHEAVVHGTYSRASSGSGNMQGHGTEELTNEQGTRSSLPSSTHKDTTLHRGDGRLDHCSTDSTKDDALLSAENSSRPSPPRGRTAGANAVGAAGDAAAATHTEFSVEVSYLEIYNETLRDLFNPTAPAAAGSGNGNGGASGDRGTSALSNNGGAYATHGSGLRLREDPISGTYVEGLTSIAVSSWDEMSQLLTYGGGERTTAATNANDWSSRSHAVFTLTFRQTSEALSPTGSSYESWEACSSVNLVDLAGSERVSHTGATGLRLQEAGSINRSLAALSDVIKALSEVQRRRPAGGGGARSPSRQKSPGRAGRGPASTAPRGFVPYRNSVLTRLLKESLGGNSRTVMLACVSPCDAHYEETLGTLRYAERAKKVRTRAIANAHRGITRGGTGTGLDQGALVERLTAQIFELRNQLAQATIATNSVGPMLPSALPPPSGSRPAEGAVTNPERCASSSSKGHPPAQAAGGQGYIYVVDPALHVEIERLRETVADRERVIENMQTEERHQSSYETPPPTETEASKSGDGRDMRRKKGGGDEGVADSGSLSTRSDVCEGGSSSPSSSTSVSASASVLSSSSSGPGRLSILTSPRGGAPRVGGGGGGRAGKTVRQRASDEQQEVEQANEILAEKCRRGGGETGMRLINLNQDPMFSECISFPIREDGVTVVGSGADADVRLAGDDVLPRHAVISTEPDGTAVLSPLSGARVYVNGIPLSGGVKEREGGALECQGDEGKPGQTSSGLEQERSVGTLQRNSRVLFGSRHFFRVDGGTISTISRGSSSSSSSSTAIRGPGGTDDPSGFASMPATIDWDFAQRELREIGSNSQRFSDNKGGNLNTTNSSSHTDANPNRGSTRDADPRGDEKDDSGGSKIKTTDGDNVKHPPSSPRTDITAINLVDQERQVDRNVTLEASAEETQDSEPPAQLRERTTIPGGGAQQEDDAPSSPALENEPSPIVESVAKATGGCETSETMDGNGAPADVPSLSSPPSTRSEEAPRTASAQSAPGASAAATKASSSTNLLTKPEGLPEPQVQAESEPPTQVARSSTTKPAPNAREPLPSLSPSSPCVPHTETAAATVAEGGEIDEQRGTYSHEGETTVAIENPPAVADHDILQTAAATGEAAHTTAVRGKTHNASRLGEQNGDGHGVIPVAEGRPATDDEDRGVVDDPGSNLEQTGSERHHHPDDPSEPSSPTPPLPRASTRDINTAAQNTGSRAEHVNKAILIELQRAREAWRGAEGELERSQEEMDELRATLQTVQEQARERRRSDRKEKRELDKEKTLAEYKARALEADRDRLRQMLSKSDEEVADLRSQLQKAQTAAVDAATAAAAAAAAAQPNADELRPSAPAELLSAKSPSTVVAEEEEASAGQYHPNRNRRASSTVPADGARHSADDPGGGVRQGREFKIVVSGEQGDQENGGGRGTSAFRATNRLRRQRGGGADDGGPLRGDSAGKLEIDGSDEEGLDAVVGGGGAGVTAFDSTAAHPAHTKRQQQQPAVGGYHDDDIFMKESRAEVEAARRLLDRYSTATNAAGRGNESDRAAERTPRDVEAEKQHTDATFRGPADVDVAETDHAENSRSRSVTQSIRSHPSGTIATGGSRVAARGRADLPGNGAAEDFYRAALSTHISFITTNATDDPPSRRPSQDGDAFQDVGRQEAGGVGEACRALQGDVAGVRQRLEAIQSKFSREESQPLR